MEEAVVGIMVVADEKVVGFVVTDEDVVGKVVVAVGEVVGVTEVADKVVGGTVIIADDTDVDTDVEVRPVLVDGIEVKVNADVVIGNRLE